MNPSPNNTLKTSKGASTSPRRSLRLSFSLGSILVVTVVVAFLGAILGQLFHSIANPSPANVGYFALAAALGPSAILIVAGTAFKVLSWIKKQQSEHVANSDL